METVTMHPMEALILHLAKKLRDQYANLEDRDVFDRLIADVETYLEKHHVDPKANEPGKMPPPPEEK